MALHNFISIVDLIPFIILPHICPLLRHPFRQTRRLSSPLPLPVLLVFYRLFLMKCSRYFNCLWLCVKIIVLQFFSSTETILHIYTSAIRSCYEYSCHIWSGASAVYLEILEKSQRRICDVSGNYSDEHFCIVHCLYEFKRSTSSTEF